MPISPSELARVRQLSLFRDCPEAVFEQVLEGGYVQSLPPGTELISEGEPVRFLHVLLDGRVRLGSSLNGKDSTMAVLRPVSSFILAAVVLEADALTSAATLSRARLLTVPGDALRAAAAREPALAYALARELAGCYRGVVRSVKNQKLRGGLERLANYLLSEQLRQGGGATLHLPHDKRLLASLIGIAPENLSRAFAKLAEHGVEVRGPDVDIRDGAALRRLARPHPLIDNPLGAAGELSGKADRERWPASLER